ncbi:hypothetical protein KP509_24G028900 [Ceratopteris richardii]|uniref:EF-hand domain-containing protein n=1 Tax=Ceratopteris richardii TaxID=49495 RepID=A0A8T2RV50_CERRI|nr:hypothetical protein KP509_24G028900 [Ceratopteris richardii]
MLEHSFCCNPSARYSKRADRSKRLNKAIYSFPVSSMKLQINLNHSIRTSSSCSSSASSPTSTSPRKKFGLLKLYLGRSASTREHSEGEHLHHKGSPGSSATSTPMSMARQEVIGSLSPMLSKGYGVEDLEGVRKKGVPTRISLQELEEVFAQLNANGDGKISSEELRWVLSSLGKDLMREEAALMIADIDRDGDGFIDLAEFVEIV